MELHITDEIAVDARREQASRVMSSDNLSAEQIAIEAARVLERYRGLDVALYDVTRDVGFTDFFVVATGMSKKHMRAMADRVVRHFRTLNHTPEGVEGKAVGNWVLVDIGGCIVQLFSRELREYYGLDHRWKKIPEFAWKGSLM